VDVFDQLGLQGFVRLAAATHARCLADPVLNHPFGRPDLDPDHVGRLGSYWAAVFGGPESDVDHVAMLDLHAHQGMDPDLGDRFYACFEGALDDVGVTSPALRRPLLAYMRWAVDDVMQYDDPDTVVPRDAPMPRWSQA
jgi:hemoglobin